MIESCRSGGRRASWTASIRPSPPRRRVTSSSNALRTVASVHRRSRCALVGGRRKPKHHFSAAGQTQLGAFGRAPQDRRARSRDFLIGLAPGRKRATHQSRPASGRKPPCRYGSRPARTSEDLPLPDVPTTATNLCARRRRKLLALTLAAEKQILLVRLERPQPGKRINGQFGHHRVSFSSRNELSGRKGQSRRQQMRRPRATAQPQASSPVSCDHSAAGRCRSPWPLPAAVAPSDICASR